MKLTPTERRRIERVMYSALATELDSHKANWSHFIFGDGEVPQEVVDVRLDVLDKVIAFCERGRSKSHPVQACRT